MGATFWTVAVVSLNTPHAVVDIRPLPESPAFQTRASCEAYAKSTGVTGAVCFVNGAPLTLSGKDEATSQANVSIMGTPWGDAKQMGDRP